jgi:hypothetical protein
LCLRKQLRQTVILTAATALITAVISIWATTVSIDHAQKHPDAAVAASSVDLMKKIGDALNDAMNFADGKVEPVD